MFIPSGCTGIILPLEEVISGIPSGKYPAFEALMTGGVAELYQLAQVRGFAADPQGYPSGCALCFHIRRWLCTHNHSHNHSHTHTLSPTRDCAPSPFPELDAEHYDESLKHYK